MPHRSTSPHLASTVFMVKPKQFGFNQQTASTNAFQKNMISSSDIHNKAIAEFDDAVHKLDSHGIEVLVYSSDDADAPDAIFPNNWFSTHNNGTLVLYPMQAPNRRRERSEQAIDYIKRRSHCKQVIDLSASENTNVFLEGTGSIIFDHANQNAYASLSPRTNKDLFDAVCKSLNYQPVSFHCVAPNGMPFYHTNVILHIGNHYAVIYDEGINDVQERKRIIDNLQASEKEIIHLSYEQVESFCGNMLQLQNNRGIPYIICSETARNKLTPSQLSILERYAEILPCKIPVIEQIGGGSIRCMIAELF